MNPDAIETTMEIVADAIGDPADLIYDKVFHKAPDLRGLFVLDTDGAVRGEMLFRVFELIIDLAQGRGYAEQLLRTEYVNHQGLGVPQAQFILLFDAIIETFREALDDQWTPDIDLAWTQLHERIAAITTD